MILTLFLRADNDRDTHTCWHTYAHRHAMHTCSLTHDTCKHVHSLNTYMHTHALSPGMHTFDQHLYLATFAWRNWASLGVPRVQRRWFFITIACEILASRDLCTALRFSLCGLWNEIRALVECVHWRWFLIKQARFRVTLIVSQARVQIRTKMWIPLFT